MIGNPPYGAKLSSSEKKTLRTLYPETQFKIDTYSLFLLKSTALLRKMGVCTYIIPNTLLDNYFEEQVRKKLLKEFRILEICDLNDKVFDAAVVHSMIFTYQNESLQNYLIKVNNSKSLLGTYNKIPNTFFADQQKTNLSIGTHSSSALISKLKLNSVSLNTVLDIRQAIKSGNDKMYISKSKLDSNYKPILRGKDVLKFSKKNPQLYIHYGKHLACPRDYRIFEQEKLLIREAGAEITATYDNEDFYIMSSLYNGILISNDFHIKYVLGLLNSKLFQHLMFIQTFEKTQGAFTKAKIYHYDNLPIKISEYQNQVILVVDSLLLGENSFKKDLMFDLDILVYKIYDLSFEEVKLIDPDFKLIKEDYDKFIFQ
ncbi:TaqI-like C-terminal specificity domain-containing protein [Epilithonimonas ginsengisoli]|uniref:site-specific DNA-methyltransferase (adenine-specific) n=1 Tax=Epilithonimonas ginsengisoli TaxID=1245592 RepID=A0ABU4JGU9_9FLAO|nr:TaqI-like C-terminal specificity domain-containing protein [Epilithonimonas ginsengisoli]MBV6878789.1 Eco57I restriction-modification methylase domain-containing protein [Epilithonimonas sp. FP105]MDW8548880.1 TaqI-like C-terminal specificity domain-containing protein [Epilithonimonas ginsengisoli]OAH66496.1 hypothetical protein AXA65_17870 [Chryseobacterium sp. FP211-J200]